MLGKMHKADDLEAKVILSGEDRIQTSQIPALIPVFRFGTTCKQLFQELRFSNAGFADKGHGQ